MTTSTTAASQPTLQSLTRVPRTGPVGALNSSRSWQLSSHRNQAPPAPRKRAASVDAAVTQETTTASLATPASSASTYSNRACGPVSSSSSP